jgi:predicted RNA methylase
MSGDPLKSLRSRGPAWLPWNRSRGQRTLLQSRELLYERVFSNALPRLQIENRYYPLRSAANYSLMYLILRVVTELPVHRVLEFGCGQTTLLLDDLARRRPLEVASIEQDPVWTARIQAKVTHRVTQAPLVERRIRGVECLAYDMDPSDLGPPVDVMIVDGPWGRRRYSRWGVLEYIDKLLAQDFVIIFDDAQRKGEQDTIAAVLDLLNGRGLNLAYGITRALHTQFLIAAGSYREAAYY